MPPLPKFCCGVALLALLGPANSSVRAQPPAAKAASLAPTLTTPSNLGAKLGGVTELALTGTNLMEVTEVWTSFGGKVTVADGQKDPALLKVSLDVPKTASPGFHTLRVATRQGLSNFRPITLDELPDLAETDKNRAKSTPQAVPNPCVIRGNADAESSDFFRFPVQAGVPVTVEVVGRRLGSPIDPVLMMHDGSGKEVAGLYADDTPGLQSDARVVFTPKVSGEMIAEVRDTTYRGGADYTYRLRVGSFPGVTTAYPVAVQVGKPTPVSFAGPSAADIPPVLVNARARGGLNVEPRRAGGLGGVPVPVTATDEPQLVEQEPNNDPAKANPLPVPCGVTAKFDTKSDIDCFRFPAKKDKKYSVTAVTAGVNSPAEVLLRIQDAKGVKLVESNPTLPVSKAEHTATADGELVVVCEHLNYLAGPNEIYWLQLREVTPDFTLTLGADRLAVPDRGVGLIPITNVTRLNGLAGPIQLSLTSPDGHTGQLELPATVNPTPALPIYLPIELNPDATLGAGVVGVQGRANMSGVEILRPASLTEIVKASLGGLPNPPPELLSSVGLAVTPEVPFRIVLTVSAEPVRVGSTVKGTIRAKRAKTFTDEIALSAVANPANATLKFVPVAKDKSAADFELTLPANTPVGFAQLIVRGSAKEGGKEVSAVTVPRWLNVVAAPKAEEPKKEKK